MVRVKKWVENLSWRRRLVLYGYMVLVPILLIICYVMIYINYDGSIEERQRQDLKNVSALADSVRMAEEPVERISTYLCINDDVLRLLASGDVDRLNRNPRLWFERAPMSLVQDMISLNSDINSISIYPENGISPYLRGMDGSAYQQDFDTVREGNTYKLALDAHMLWKYVPKQDDEIFQVNKQDKLLLCREMYDLSQKVPMGFITIGVNLDYIQDLCDKLVERNSESVLVLDPDGGLLCKSGELPDWLFSYLSEDSFLKVDYRDRKESFTYNGYSIVCNQNEAGAGIVCKVAPISDTRINICDVIYMPVILMVGVLLGFFPLMTVTSRAVTGPLKQLSRRMELVSAGDFTQKVEVVTNDEIGEVCRCFNKMVDDIRELIDENYVIKLRERESELAALQAQINPHLLYNALDSLYWQIEETDHDDIAENVYALSQLFRLLLSRGQSEVPLIDEIELVSRYLQIQKMRFGEKLNYSIDVDDSVQEVIMPKLILQPFVENAVVHGFEDEEKPCMITVNVREQEGFVRFEIADTGKGMTKEQMAALWRDEPSRYSKQRIGGYALKNIRERLRLKYGEDFILDIMSTEGEGTTVLLMIPFE